MISTSAAMPACCQHQAQTSLGWHLSKTLLPMDVDTSAALGTSGGERARFEWKGTEVRRISHDHFHSRYVLHVKPHNTHTHTQFDTCTFSLPSKRPTLSALGRITRRASHQASNCLHDLFVAIVRVWRKELLHKEQNPMSFECVRGKRRRCLPTTRAAKTSHHPSSIHVK